MALPAPWSGRGLWPACHGGVHAGVWDSGRSSGRDSHSHVQSGPPVAGLAPAFGGCENTLIVRLQKACKLWGGSQFPRIRMVAGDIPHLPCALLGVTPWLLTFSTPILGAYCWSPVSPLPA